MDSSHLFTDDSINSKKSTDLHRSQSGLNGDDSELAHILGEYKDLLELQADERKRLLLQVDNLSEKTKNIDLLDNKIEHLISLLADIRKQISALSTVMPPTKSDDNLKPSEEIPSIQPFISKPKVLASEDEINKLSEEIENEAENLDNDISTLTDLISAKTQEINQKDIFIEQLNEKLTHVSDEKDRLAIQLESLNSVIGSWQGQLSLLQKLAQSDPRYKVIGSLKKHGSLSDIQLAFTMGTSISQIRKYIQDLIELELVRKDNSGRYIWIGSSSENQG